MNHIIISQAFQKEQNGDKELRRSIHNKILECNGPNAHMSDEIGKKACIMKSSDVTGVSIIRNKEANETSSSSSSRAMSPYLTFTNYQRYLEENVQKLSGLRDNGDIEKTKPKNLGSMEDIPSHKQSLILVNGNLNKSSFGAPCYQSSLLIPNIAHDNSRPKKHKILEKFDRVKKRKNLQQHLENNLNMEKSLVQANPCGNSNSNSNGNAVQAGGNDCAILEISSQNKANFDVNSDNKAIIDSTFHKEHSIMIPNLDSLPNENENFKTEIQKLRSENERLSAETQKLRFENEKLRLENEKSLKDIKSNQQYMNECSKRIADLIYELNFWTSDSTRLLIISNDLRKKHETQRLYAQHLKKAKEDVENENKKLRKYVNDVKNSLRNEFMKAIIDFTNVFHVKSSEEYQNMMYVNEEVIEIKRFVYERLKKLEERFIVDKDDNNDLILKSSRSNKSESKEFNLSPKSLFNLPEPSSTRSYNNTDEYSLRRRYLKNMNIDSNLYFSLSANKEKKYANTDADMVSALKIDEDAMINVDNDNLFSTNNTTQKFIFERNVMKSAMNEISLFDKTVQLGKIEPSEVESLERNRLEEKNSERYKFKSCSHSLAQTCPVILNNKSRPKWKSNSLLESKSTNGPSEWDNIEKDKVICVDDTNELSKNPLLSQLIDQKSQGTNKIEDLTRALDDTGIAIKYSSQKRLILNLTTKISYYESRVNLLMDQITKLNAKNEHLLNENTKLKKDLGLGLDSLSHSESQKAQMTENLIKMIQTLKKENGLLKHRIYGTLENRIDPISIDNMPKVKKQADYEDKISEMSIVEEQQEQGKTRWEVKHELDESKYWVERIRDSNIDKGENKSVNKESKLIDLEREASSVDKLTNNYTSPYFSVAEPAQDQACLHQDHKEEEKIKPEEYPLHQLYQSNTRILNVESRLTVGKGLSKSFAGVKCLHDRLQQEIKTVESQFPRDLTELSRVKENYMKVLEVIETLYRCCLDENVDYLGAISSRDEEKVQDYGKYIKTRIADIKQRLFDLSQSNKKLEDDLKELHLTKASQESQILMLTEQLSSSKNQIHILETELYHIKKHNSSLSQETSMTMNESSHELIMSSKVLNQRIDETFRKGLISSESIHQEQAKISESEPESESLVMQINSLKDINQTLEQTIKEFQSKLDRFEQENAQFQEQIHCLDMLLAQANAQIKSNEVMYQTQIEELSSKINNLKEELEKIKEDHIYQLECLKSKQKQEEVEDKDIEINDESSKQLVNERGMILGMGYQETDETICDEKKNTNIIQTELNLSFDTTFAQKSHDFSAEIPLEKVIDNLKQELQLVVIERDKALNTIKELREEVAGLNMQLGNQLAQLHNSKSLISSYSMEITSYKKQVVELDEEVKELEANQVEVEEALTKKQKKIDQLNDEIKIKNNIIEEREGIIITLTEQIDEKDNILSNIYDQIEDLKQYLYDKDKKINELERDLAHKEEILIEKEMIISKMSEKVDVLIQDKIDQKSSISPSSSLKSSDQSDMNQSKDKVIQAKQQVREMIKDDDLLIEKLHELNTNQVEIKIKKPKKFKFEKAATEFFGKSFLESKEPSPIPEIINTSIVQKSKSISRHMNETLMNVEILALRYQIKELQVMLANYKKRDRSNTNPDIHDIQKLEKDKQYSLQKLFQSIQTFVNEAILINTSKFLDLLEERVANRISRCFEQVQILRLKKKKRILNPLTKRSLSQSLQIQRRINSEEDEDCNEEIVILTTGESPNLLGQTQGQSLESITIGHIHQKPQEQTLVSNVETHSKTSIIMMNDSRKYYHRLFEMKNMMIDLKEQCKSLKKEFMINQEFIKYQGRVSWLEYAQGKKEVLDEEKKGLLEKENCIENCQVEEDGKMVIKSQ